MGSYKPEPYGMIDTLPNSVLQETRLSQVSLERRFIGWGVPQLVMSPGTAECSAWFVSSLSHPESPAPTELWKTKHNRSCALMSPHCFRPLPPNHRSLHGYTHVNPPGLSRLCCFTEADKRGSEGTRCVCVCVSGGWKRGRRGVWDTMQLHEKGDETGRWVEREMGGRNWDILKAKQRRLAWIWHEAEIINNLCCFYLLIASRNSLSLYHWLASKSENLH